VLSALTSASFSTTVIGTTMNRASMAVVTGPTIGRRS
jgi:hypothetical protein